MGSRTALRWPSVGWLDGVPGVRKAMVVKAGMKAMNLGHGLEAEDQPMVRRFKWIFFPLKKVWWIFQVNHVSFRNLLFQQGEFSGEPC